MNTLVISPNWIGDCLMTQPLLGQLKQQGHILTLLAPPWVAPIFRLMPEVSHVIEMPLQHGKLQLRTRWSMARQLRQQFDAAYILPNTLKSALIPWLARIPQRIGYLGEQRALLLTAARPNPSRIKRPSMLQHYAALASPTAASPTAHLPDPQLQISPAQIRQTREALCIPENARVIAFCPGAEYGPAKRWPTTHFAQLARRIAAHDPQIQIILLGSAKDKSIGEAICSTLDQSLQGVVRNLCGQTTLEQACALLASCSAVISNDSGLMHVTAALHRPQIALFGSSDPRHTPPHSPRATVEWLALECSPCFQRECPLGHLHCLNQLSPERVWQNLEKQLSSPAPSGEELT